MTVLETTAAGPPIDDDGRTPASPVHSRGSAFTRHAEVLRFAFKYRHVGRSVNAATNGPAILANAPMSNADAQAFATDLQALGPTFIKLGQTLSTRPDLLPPDYIEALQSLQDDVPPVDFETIRATVEAELGVRISKAFASFEREPLAAASLAQVHAATLRDGRDVVVKVQRPHVAEDIARDLQVLGRVVYLADRWTESGRRARFVRWLEEVTETLAEELDYRREASNLITFHGNLAPYPNLTVPLPIHDLSSSRVLTMERIAGTKVNQAVELKRLESPLGELGSDVLRAYLDQIFVNGLVHADPHPGNVMLTTDNRLALVDLGMVFRLPPRTRDVLLKLLLAAVEGHGDEVAELCIAHGESLEMFDEYAWRRRCSRLIGRYATQGAARDLSEGRLMMELTRMSLDSGLRPPADMALLGKTMLNLDAIATILDPSQSSREIVRGHLDELLQKRMRSSLSPSTMASELLDITHLARDLPRQAHGFMQTIAENRLRVRVSGLEESRLLENLQKIANRITCGLISAALIVGAALVMRIPTNDRLFGYPAIAMGMFLLATGLGIALIVSMLLGDRKLSRYRSVRK